MDMKKLFGFGSNTPSPPPPPSRPPAPPLGKSAPPAVKPAASIVCRWKDPAGSDITEFGSDGTVIERPASGDTIRGRYALDGSKLKIKLEGAAEELVFPVKIATDTLQMTDPEGQVTSYQRI